MSNISESLHLGVFFQQIQLFLAFADMLAIRAILNQQLDLFKFFIITVYLGWPENIMGRMGAHPEQGADRLQDISFSQTLPV